MSRHKDNENFPNSLQMFGNLAIHFQIYAFLKIVKEEIGTIPTKK